jgi:vitamin B12 transporter
MKKHLQLLLLTIFLSAARINAGENDDAEKVYQAEPIVVTATRLPSHPQDTPFEVTVIPAKEIAGEKDLADVVGEQAGVDLRRYGGEGTAASLSFRGSSANQVLLLYDGIPINSAYGGDVDFNNLVLGGFNQVEVLRGPASALYGSNALGGVVNLVSFPLNTYGDTAPHGSFSTTLGPDNHYSSDSNVKWFGKCFSVNGALSQCHDDGFRKNSDFSKTGGSFKLNFNLPNNGNVYLSATGGNSELGVIGPLSMEDPTARQKDWQNMVYGGGEIPLQSWLGTKFTIYRRATERFYTSEMWMTETDQQLTTKGGTAELHISLPGSQQMLFSGEATDDHLLSTDLGEKTARNYAFLWQDLFTYRSLEMVGGMRYDRNRQWGTEISPRFGLNYKFSPWLSLRGAYARGFRPPTMVELYWPSDPYFGGGGNPNLKPEHSWSLEEGIELKLFNKATLGISAYYQKYKDLISGWPPENIASARSLGVELNWSWTIGYGLALSASYSHNDMRDEEGNWLEYHPRHLLHGELDWATDLHQDIKLESGLTLDYTSSRNATYYQGADQLTTLLPAVTLLSAKLRLEPKPFFVELRVDNLTNTQYQLIYDYPQPGRQLFISAGFEF